MLLGFEPLAQKPSRVGVQPLTVDSLPRRWVRKKGSIKILRPAETATGRVTIFCRSGLRRLTIHSTSCNGCGAEDVHVEATLADGWRHRTSAHTRRTPCPARGRQAYGWLTRPQRRAFRAVSRSLRMTANRVISHGSWLGTRGRSPLL